MKKSPSASIEAARARLWDDDVLRAQLRAEHICWHHPCLFCALFNDLPIPSPATLAYDDLTSENRASLGLIIENLHTSGARRRAAADAATIFATRAARFAAAHAEILARQARLFSQRNQIEEQTTRQLRALRRQAKVPYLSIVERRVERRRVGGE